MTIQRGRSRAVGGLSRLHRQRSVRAGLALADQAVVSGVSFLTTIVIGRVCGKLELGIYALGISIVFLAIAAQQSLISAAHTVFSVRLEGEARRQYNGAIGVQFSVLCLLIAIILGIVLLGLCVSGSATAEVFLALMVACPGILLREFARRFEFARFNMFQAFLLDVIIALLLLVFLGSLASAGLLSGAMGLVAVGTACFVAGGLWFLANRSQFQLAGTDLARECKRGWQFGRWVFGGQISFAMVGFAIQWLTAATIGKAAVGIYSACMMLVLFANPIVLGLQNMLSPSIAKAMHESGHKRVRQVVAKSTAMLALLMIAYLSIVYYWSDTIMLWLYGDSFVGNSATVALLGCGALATAIGVSSNHGLCALERPELNFVASFIGLWAGLLTATCFLSSWGVAGAALGFAVSCGLTSSIRMAAFAAVSQGTTETL